MFGVQRIGRYEVLGHLASGGMGQVYLARATGLGGFERQVVVKTLDLSITDDDEAFVTMFLDEARLVGALHHQYIAPVYEVGCDEQGHYFLVMDYVHGETAEAVFRVSGERAQPMPLAFALTVGSCVASALDYAHNLCAADGTPLDIVHRDVSLSNVMCGHDGAVKLIDFGIAKAANRATKTQVGTLKGKIGYLAPEQILRGPVDHRADIFALGIVLYELTTGTRAFRDTSDLITLERITNGEIRRPSEIVPGYPPELERIVMKALQTEPAKRYQDAATLGRALETFAAGRQIALGHAAIVATMTRLFGDRRARRRLARGSNEVKTDPTIQALTGQDEKTPITDALEGETVTQTLEGETITRNVAAVPDARSERAQRPTLPLVDRTQRPTTPIVERKTRGNEEQPAIARAPTPQKPVVARVPTGPQLPPSIPLEDQPTPVADPALELRARHALIPLEDRPTPVAEPTPPFALPLAPPERPTPPQRRSAPRAEQKIPTGPQLPIELEDAATEIAATVIDNDDPLGSDAATVLERDAPTGEDAATDGRRQQNTIQRPPPAPAPAPGPSLHRTATARVKWPRAPEPGMRTWLVLCGMFAIAVVVAILVAML